MSFDPAGGALGASTRATSNGFNQTRRGAWRMPTLGAEGGPAEFPKTACLRARLRRGSPGVR